MRDVERKGPSVSTATKRARNNHQPTGQWIRAEKRLAIYLRDGMRCLYCLADLHGADPRDITLDHLTPKADGGSNHESNLVTACRSCNCSRQDTPLSRFAGPETRKHVRRNVKRSLKPYLVLAKALISGEAGFEETFKNING
jgi:5-methylcytosine-specific restriction endonuclease McrA